MSWNAGAVARRLALCTALSSTALAAQPPAAASAQAPRSDTIAAAISAEPSGESAVIVLFNRPIVTLRARVLGRGAAERAAGASRALDELVAQQVKGPVELRPFAGGAMITVNARGIFALTNADVDELGGETFDAVANDAADRLRQALAEAVDARAPRVWLRSITLAAIGLCAGIGALWILIRGRRAIAARLVAAAERAVTQARLADLEVLRASRLLELERRLVSAVFGLSGIVVAYATTTFVLRAFAYTRPWGDSMSGYLLTTTAGLGLAMLGALPGLFTAALILLIARLGVRVIEFAFNAVEQGRLTLRYIYPETAQPTRRLVTALVWLFAAVMAYPYLPGSGTDAFKGVSVFVGLMVTFGSSGLVNQIMSGLMITYSRALRHGDFVRIGDVDGTVTHLGVLSIKIRTLRSEEVTIPNAVVVAQTTTDFSRASETVLTPISVTIGYDAPWRQVQALLLLAAERTPGIRSTPEPAVLQAALEDFYVKYTLLVCLEHQEDRPRTLHQLHAHIQDLFNQYGVQIMSPNYVLDPEAPKIVARKDWFAAPARPEPIESGV